MNYVVSLNGTWLAEFDNFPLAKTFVLEKIKGKYSSWYNSKAVVFCPANSDDRYEIVTE